MRYHSRYAIAYPSFIQMDIISRNLRISGLIIAIVSLYCGVQETSEDSRDPIECNDSMPIHSGVATYYIAANGSGNCCFPPTPEDLMVGAMNHAEYDNSYACGSCVEIDGPDSTIRIRIVDQCPECEPGHIDLSPLAFSLIAPMEHGKVPITWRVTSCPVTGPIIYHFKEKSNPWWIAIQIRNHRYPILTFEFQDEDKIFTELPRTSYNYFLKKDGLGSGPFIFRVTDIFGHQLTDTVAPDGLDSVEVPGNAQFPLCE